MSSSGGRGIHAAWNDNAEFWDETVGLDGNQYWQQLQKPSLERLVPVRPGCKALDLATGNGLVARWLAAKGADVTGTDGSEKMIERAVQRSSDEQRIAYTLLDVTLPEALDEFLCSREASEGFDIVTCNMALMDISDLEPLARALPKLLKRNGIFFATTLHPVFLTSGATKFVEVDTDPETGESRSNYSRIIREYREKQPWRGVAVSGQPTAHLYYHRPLDVLLGTFFKTGLVMDNMEELYLGQEHGASERSEATANFTQIPVVMALRFRNAA
ncbi:hypothetical protein QQS21_004479 [Conoideocrella luteorostrata]|uniref:Methyltransferase type 11 domain-containing protein n=1 Tax=Conoideocrella luteorostrata TaxID=1105319 RepID=A0AAJ0FZS8_9HYPO|nr:hypothetical protein QQS21_004479 [Conoideocrella luteorostrata]